jgi:hypothetical protein
VDAGGETAVFPTGIALFLRLVVDKGGEGGYSGTHEIGVWDAGVCEPLRREFGREMEEALLAVRPPIEGRFLLSCCSAARRKALPWVREPKASISFRMGLKANSKSWTIWSMSGGGDGNPSSSQKV